MKRVAAMVMAVLLVLCGCTPKPAQTEETSKTVCVILKAKNSVYWLSVENGLRQAASDFGVSVNVLYPETEDDSRAQEVMIKNAILAEPDAIAVAPCDSRNMELLKLTEHHGVRAYYIDSSSDKYACPYIGSDNYHIGELAAQELASVCDSGSLAVIAGNLAQGAHQQRLQGFQDYIRENTALKVEWVKDNPAVAELEGMESMREILQEDPEIRGVFCTSSMLVLGAMQECEAQERMDVRLIGVDTQSDALFAVAQGNILAMIGQDGYQIGYQTIKTIAQALKEEQTDESDVYVESEVITQDNVRDYLSNYGR